LIIPVFLITGFWHPVSRRLTGEHELTAITLRYRTRIGFEFHGGIAFGDLLFPKPKSKQNAFLSPEPRLSFVPVKNPQLASLKQGILFHRCKRRSSHGDEIKYNFKSLTVLVMRIRYDIVQESDSNFMVVLPLATYFFQSQKVSKTLFCRLNRACRLYR